MLSQKAQRKFLEPQAVRHTGVDAGVNGSAQIEEPDKIGRGSGGSALFIYAFHQLSPREV